MTKEEAGRYISGLTREEKEKLRELLKAIEREREKKAPGGQG